MSEDSPQADSPIHSGDRQVQKCLGVRDKIEASARLAVHDHMPEQHREFFAPLLFVPLGTVDDQGRPWASLVSGRPGFMTGPDSSYFTGADLVADGGLMQV